MPLRMEETATVAHTGAQERIEVLTRGGCLPQRQCEAERILRIVTSWATVDGLRCTSWTKKGVYPGTHRSSPRSLPLPPPILSPRCYPHAEIQTTHEEGKWCSVLRDKRQVGLEHSLISSLPPSLNHSPEDIADKWLHAPRPPCSIAVLGPLPNRPPSRLHRSFLGLGHVPGKDDSHRHDLYSPKHEQRERDEPRGTIFLASTIGPDQALPCPHAPVYALG